MESSVEQELQIAQRALNGLSETALQLEQKFGRLQQEFIQFRNDIQACLEETPTYTNINKYDHLKSSITNCVETSLRKTLLEENAAVNGSIKHETSLEDMDSEVKKKCKTAPPELTDLDPAILIKILNYVHPSDLLKNVVRVSKYFCKLIDHPGVNFINILRTNFLYKCCFSSFFYIHVTREKLLKQHLHEKCVHKILMKLTVDVRISLWLGEANLKADFMHRRSHQIEKVSISSTFYVQIFHMNVVSAAFSIYV